MYTRRNIRWHLVFHFSWKPVLCFALWDVLVTVTYLWLRPRGYDISIPLAPLGTIGVAVAFYVGFKNDQSYDRSWEARKIWGGIVNASRSFAAQTLSLVRSEQAGSDLEVRKQQQKLIYRHLAWMNALRYQLRQKSPSSFALGGIKKTYQQPTDRDAMREELSLFLSSDELNQICQLTNPATQIMNNQADHLSRLADEEGWLKEFRLISLIGLVNEMYTLQGQCERIKNTPFPRQYAYFSQVFIWIFIGLVPFGLVNAIGERGNPMIWITVPLSVLTAWIFFTMEIVGDGSEDPFENFATDVPMTALCRTIEIDLRQMLGEDRVPPPMKPENDILM